jgi:hypothetical protein
MIETLTPKEGREHIRRIDTHAATPFDDYAQAAKGCGDFPVVPASIFKLFQHVNSMP